MRPFFTTLTDRARRSGPEPFVTWYGAAGRSELSVRTFTNAVAKTAGLLDDELMVEPEQSIVLDLGLHWQTSVWLAAADVVGLDITLLDPAGSTPAPPADFVATMDPLFDSAAQRILVSPSPLGMPQGEAPPDFVDHAREAIGQPDHYAGPVGSGRIRVGDRMLDRDEVGDAVAAITAAGPAVRDGRVAITAVGAQAAIHLYALAILAPASLVLVDAAGADGIIASEHATTRLP